MARFELRTFDAQRAQVSTRVIEAADDGAARAMAAVDGSTLLSLKALRAPPSAGQARLDVAWWCRELRTLVGAGMTVVEALETLRAQPLGQARQQLHHGLLQHLNSGVSLSEAMRQVGHFPVMLVAGVKAGERTSALAAALDDYLRYHDMLAQLRQRALSAAIYPAMVLVLGLFIAAFLLVVVVPRFSAMYADMAGSLSLTTRTLLAVSAALAEHRLVLASAAAAGLLVMVWAWRSGAVQRAAATLAEGLLPLRQRIDEFRFAKLYQSLALLIKGGYALDDALRQCEALGLGSRLEAGVRVACDALSTGRRVSDAFAAGGLTDPVTQRLLAVGERTGSFELVLQTVAERHAQNFETLIERVTRVIEPLMLLGVALLIGGLVLAMYMPVFDIASSLR